MEDELRYHDRNNNNHHHKYQQGLPQDLLANTRTRPFAIQPAFLPLKNVSVSIEVSTGAGKLRTVISGFRRDVNDKWCGRKVMRLIFFQP